MAAAMQMPMVDTLSPQANYIDPMASRQSVLSESSSRGFGSTSSMRDEDEPMKVQIKNTFIDVVEEDSDDSDLAAAERFQRKASRNWTQPARLGAKTPSDEEEDEEDTDMRALASKGSRIMHVSTTPQRGLHGDSAGALKRGLMSSPLTASSFLSRPEALLEDQPFGYLEEPTTPTEVETRMPRPARELAPPMKQVMVSFPLEVPSNLDMDIEKLVASVQAVHSYNLTGDGSAVMELRVAVSMPAPVAQTIAAGAMVAAVANTPSQSPPLSPTTTYATQSSWHSGGGSTLASPVGSPLMSPLNSTLMSPRPSSSTTTTASTGGAPNSSATVTKNVTVCCHWKNKGFCKLGDGCKFMHPPHKQGVGSTRRKLGTPIDAAPVDNAAATKAQGNSTSGRKSARTGQHGRRQQQQQQQQQQQPQPLQAQQD